MVPSIRNMRVEDVETVARMDALDHDSDLEMGMRKLGSTRLTTWRLFRNTVTWWKMAM